MNTNINDDFQREELWKLMRRAEKWQDIVVNPSWKRAYEQFINACDRLDAQIARSTVYLPEIEPVAV